MKTSISAARAARSASRDRGDGDGIDPDHPLEPLGIAREPAHQDRDALGDDEMRIAQEPRQRRVEAGVEGRVAELVQHRVHPLLRRHHVRQHADVAGPVDVDAERVLALAVPREQVAAVDHGARLEPDAVVGAPRDLDQIGVLEERVEVDAALGRHLLEERVGVVPRRELADGAAEAGREPLVELRLPARERLGRGAVGVVERGHELVLVHLRRRDREREPVPVAERVRGGVAQPRELADIVGDLGSDRLRGLPGRAPLGDVVAVAQDLADLVVVDAPARRCRRGAARSASRPMPRAR